MSDLPKHERARAERIVAQAIRCFKSCETLMRADHTPSRASVASDILSAMSTAVRESQQSGLLDWTDALDLSEAILNVQERVLARREEELARHTRQ